MRGRCGSGGGGRRGFGSTDFNVTPRSSNGRPKAVESHTFRISLTKTVAGEALSSWPDVFDEAREATI